MRPWNPRSADGEITMESLDDLLDRWLEAGLVDASTLARIRSFESEHRPEQGLRWPALLAISFGALMVGGGLLLFIAAHWEGMSPTIRFLTVLALVSGFHISGALFSNHSPRVSTAIHGLGTVALGAGIFLAGQIFNLEEHWPGGVLLWALGAWIGYALLRDWVQGTLAALLTPFWLAGEWMVATRAWPPWAGQEQVLAYGGFLLALSYLSARFREGDNLLRRALMWIGGFALLPTVFAVLATSWDYHHAQAVAGSRGWLWVGWSVALAAPPGAFLVPAGEGCLDEPRCAGLGRSRCRSAEPGASFLCLGRDRFRGAGVLGAA
jgi:hypothetical protein